MREANDFVRGTISKKYHGLEAGQEVMVNALDFTSKGDDEKVTIMLAGSKKTEVLKKYLTNVLVEGRKLNEYGVYNSENDVKSNVKTKENTPDTTQAFLIKLKESITAIVGNLAELKKTVEENSKLSYDSLDICIAELESYAKSIEEESDNIGSANI